MDAGHALVCGLLELTVRLNTLALQARTLDPLLELCYTLQLTLPAPGTAPEDKVAVVRLVINRTSGHGPEGSYVMEDCFSLWVHPDRATHLRVDREGVTGKLPQMIFEAPDDVTSLLAQVERFCREVLPD